MKHKPCEVSVLKVRGPWVRMGFWAPVQKRACMFLCDNALYMLMQDANTINQRRRARRVRDWSNKLACSSDSCSGRKRACTRR